MVTIDAIEGIVNGSIRYHYDVGDDVLYLRLKEHGESAAIGEETDEGLIELREDGSNRLVGVTAVNWWKRFGRGQLPDSLREIQKVIEPLAQKLAGK